MTMGDSAVLEADSFLMKGETLPAGSLWGGNPAKPRRRNQAGATGAQERTVCGCPALALAAE